jgi:hypothetical protein
MVRSTYLRRLIMLLGVVVTSRQRREGRVRPLQDIAGAFLLDKFKSAAMHDYHEPFLCAYDELGPLPLLMKLIQDFQFNFEDCGSYVSILNRTFTPCSPVCDIVSLLRHDSATIPFDWPSVLLVDSSGLRRMDPSPTESMPSIALGDLGVSNFGGCGSENGSAGYSWEQLASSIDLIGRRVGLGPYRDLVAQCDSFTEYLYEIRCMLFVCGGDLRSALLQTGVQLFTCKYTGCLQGRVIEPRWAVSHFKNFSKVHEQLSRVVDLSRLQHSEATAPLSVLREPFTF